MTHKAQYTCNITHADRNPVCSADWTQSSTFRPTNSIHERKLLAGVQLRIATIVYTMRRRCADSETEFHLVWRSEFVRIFEATGAKSSTFSHCALASDLTLSLPIPLRLYILPYGSNPPFLIFDIRSLWRSALSARVPECQKLKM